MSAAKTLHLDPSTLGTCSVTNPLAAGAAQNVPVLADADALAENWTEAYVTPNKAKAAIPSQVPTQDQISAFLTTLNLPQKCSDPRGGTAIAQEDVCAAAQALMHVVGVGPKHGQSLQSGGRDGKPHED